MKHRALIPSGFSPDPDSAEIARLINAAALLGVNVTPAQAVLLLRHLEMVVEQTQHMNLTTITDRSQGLISHIADSLAAVAYLAPAGPETRVADIGSGAGYPGIPIAVVTGYRTVLVESLGKKAAFLQAVSAGLGISQLEIQNLRAEELALTRPETFDFVTARALSSLPALVELSAPLLSMGGRLIALKGKAEESEVTKGEAAADIVGMRRIHCAEYNLPELGHARSAYIYEKCGPASRNLPRRVGLAQKRPLG